MSGFDILDVITGLATVHLPFGIQGEGERSCTLL